MRLRKLTLILLIIAAVIVGAGSMYAGMQVLPNRAAGGTSAQNQDASDPSFAKVKKAYEIISNGYYQNVDPDKLLDGAIQGMVASLEDPFSMYMDAKTARQFTQSLSSSFQGIGAKVSMVNGKITIISPIKDSPADRAGLQPKDQIISIDGKSMQGLSLNEAVMKIRGKKGSTVTLGIVRPGESAPLTFKIKRDDIPLTTVQHSVISKNGHTFGLIAIRSFSIGTAGEFQRALSQLEEKGIDGLIIDVRGNPGGYLEAVKQVADLIVPDALPVVQRMDRSGEKLKYFSKLKKPKNYPIIGLIDGGSASAAEILSAALRQAGDYPLVGEKSFGKGTVQTEFNIGNGRLKLTVQKWLTPDGDWIHEKGIKPTVFIKEPAYFYAHPLIVKAGETLTYNQNSDAVKNAQVILKGLGFEPGREDGYFSKQTEKAVKAFQYTSHLSKTGEIDAKTAGALDERIRKKVTDQKNDLQLQAALAELEKNLSK